MRAPEQLPYEHIMMYRDTLLATESDREVLKDILCDLEYFSHNLENDEQRILHNAAMRIVAKLGVGLISQADAQVDAFRHILPPPPKETNDNGRS